MVDQKRIQQKASPFLLLILLFSLVPQCLSHCEWCKQFADEPPTQNGNYQVVVGQNASTNPATLCKEMKITCEGTYVSEVRILSVQRQDGSNMVVGKVHNSNKPITMVATCSHFAYWEYNGVPLNGKICCEQGPPVSTPAPSTSTKAPCHTTGSKEPGCPCTTTPSAGGGSTGASTSSGGSGGASTPSGGTTPSGGNGDGTTPSGGSTAASTSSGGNGGASTPSGATTPSGGNGGSSTPSAGTTEATTPSGGNGGNPSVPTPPPGYCFCPCSSSTLSSLLTTAQSSSPPPATTKAPETASPSTPAPTTAAPTPAPTTAAPTTKACPAGGTWTGWVIGPCSATCGLCGTERLSRTCTSAAAGCPCTGPASQTQPCGSPPCIYPADSCCPPIQGKSLRRQNSLRLTHLNERNITDEITFAFRNKAIHHIP